MSISTTAEKIIDIGLNALEDKKANDIKVIDISEICIVADAFIIASANNINQLQAMADEVDEKLSKAGIRPLSTEGYDKGGWILMDYNDVIFQLFDEESRKFYDIERLYADGKIITK